MPELSLRTSAFWDAENRVARRGVLLGLLLLNWALGLTRLDAKSMWLDEAYGLYVTRLGLPALWAGQSEPYHPPLFYWLLEHWLPLGSGEFLWRFPSVCFTTLSVLLAWRLACVWFGRAVGLTTAVLMAISPVLLWYAQELRPYALLVLLGLIATVAVTRLCLRPAAGPFLLAVVSITAAIYLHYFAVLLLGIHLLTWLALLAAGRTTWRALLYIAAAWLVAFAAWWPWLQSGGFALFLRLPADSGNYVAILLTQRLGVPPALLQMTYLWLLLGAAVGVGILLLLHRLLHGMHQRRTWDRLRRGRWLPLLAAALFTLLLLYWVAPRAYTAKRQLLLLVPYVLVAFAWWWPWGRRRGLLTAVTVLSLAAALTNILFVPKNQWREAATYIGAHAEPNDLVLLTPGFMTAPYDLYAPDNLPRAGISAPFDEAALAHTLAGYQRVWLITDPFDADPEQRLERWLNAHGQLIETTPFYRLDVQLYALPPPPVSFVTCFGIFVRAGSVSDPSTPSRS